MISLVEDELGRLDLTPTNGFVETLLDPGYPDVRVVKNERALSDGEDDETLYFGGRAMSFRFSINTRIIAQQDALNLVQPYLSLRRRPRLIYNLPGSTEKRSAIVRGHNAPFAVDHPKYPTWATQWYNADGLLEAPDPVLVDLEPADDVELGRTYDENMADGRGPYPSTLAIGERAVDSPGSEMSDWVLSIFGPTTNPTFRVNGIDITFDENGGLSLTSGQSVVIDTKQRSILFQNDPLESRYGKTNFHEWSWSDVRLKAGFNAVRLMPGPDVRAQLSYRPTWIL